MRKGRMAMRSLMAALTAVSAFGGAFAADEAADEVAFQHAFIKNLKLAPAQDEQFERNRHPDAQWYPKAGLGLFIHWGLSSVRGWGDLSWGMIKNAEGATKADQNAVGVPKWGLPSTSRLMPPNEYWKQIEGFDAANFNPEKFLAAAKKAGFQYAILTTKHHEGFTLWPSAVGDLSTKNHLGGRDLVKEFVEACRKVGMKACLYYSPPDWRFDRDYMSFSRDPALPEAGCDWEPRKPLPEDPKHEAARREMTRIQIEELLTRYGKIDMLWFDGMGSDVVSVKRIRELQPSCIINDRGRSHGDFLTQDSECHFPAFRRPKNLWWEYIQTLNDGGWGYRYHENYKPAAWFLCEAAKARAWGGNFVANVCPNGHGEMPETYYKVMRDIAGWMAENGEAMLKSEGTEFWPERCNVPVTRSGRTLHFFYDWHADGDVVCKGVARPVRVSAGGKDLAFTWENGVLTISFPYALRQALTSIIEVEEGDAAWQPVKPAKCHLDHFEDGVMAIVHYGLNSFCDKEWGYGDTSPAIFNPTALDANQWVSAMKDAGIRRVVMVTKHHDGFNLWPSKHNKDYTVANSPWRGGKGDLVAEVRAACLKQGLRFGTYLSPWDRHQASYGSPAYTEYFHRQFDELFDNYGPVSEIWLDGANGGDGWYGGAREKRKLGVPAWEYYRMPDVIRKMVSRYPDAIAFGGADVHSAAWVGNENGFAPESVWYETARGHWETPECDVPLRRGWFWTAHDAPKSLARLVEIYFASVGRGCVLNIGIAPNREGLVGADDAKRLKEFGDYVRAFNAVDFAKGATLVKSDCCRYLKLEKPAKVNCFDICEQIGDGQFVAGWKAEAKVGGRWTVVADGTTIGYRRLVRFAAVESDEFRVTVTDAVGPAKLGTVALRWAERVEGGEKEVQRAPLRGKGKYFTLDETAQENEIVFRFKQPIQVAGFQFDPNNNKNVLVDRYAVYTSADGKSWTKVVEDEFGNMAANPVIQYCWFKRPVRAKYLRVVALRTADGAKPTLNRADENCVLLY